MLQTVNVWLGSRLYQPGSVASVQPMAQSPTAAPSPAPRDPGSNASQPQNVQELAAAGAPPPVAAPNGSSSGANTVVIVVA